MKNATQWRYAIIKQVVEKTSSKCKISIKRHNRPLILTIRYKKPLKPILAAIKAKKEWSSWSFFTVTVALKDFDSLSEETRAKKSAYIFKMNSDKLMKRLKREYGNFQYIRVLEQCENGQLHAHFLATLKFTDIKMEHRSDGKEVSISPILKAHLTACGFGWVSHAENLQDKDGLLWSAKRSVSYVTKYMTKETGEFNEYRSGLHVRKIQTSRGILSPFNPKFNHKQEDSADWFISVGIHKKLAEEIGLEKIYDVNRKKTLEDSDFLLDDYYPPNEENNKERAKKELQSFVSSLRKE